MDSESENHDLNADDAWVDYKPSKNEGHKPTKTFDSLQLLKINKDSPYYSSKDRIVNY